MPARSITCARCCRTRTAGRNAPEGGHTAIKPLFPATIFLILTCLVTACGGGEKGGDHTDGVIVATQPPAQTQPAVRGTPEGQATTAPANDEPVSFATEDGVTLKGHFYSTPGPKRRVVVFAHEASKDQKAWQAFARELTSQGIASLTYDMRGYGETGGARDVTKADRDLETAFRFVRSRDYPLIYLVGAQVGGTAALKVAARQDLAGVAAISAPVMFMGLDARSDVAGITERKLFVAGRSDADATAAVGTFMQSARDPKQQQLYDGVQQGTDLLAGRNAASFKQLLADFLLQ